MKVDTKIINAKVFLSTDIIEAGVAINEGKIVAIGKETSLPEAEKTINAKGNLLMPGVIDGHAHLGTKSRFPDGEDFTSGSATAAVGGVTLLGVMPGGDGVLTENRDTFLSKKEGLKGKSIVDYSLLGAFSGGEDKDFSRFIPELWEEGAIAIKGYMHNHRPHRILKASYDGEMLWALEQIAKVDAIANVHCENEWMQEWNRQKIMEGDKRDAEAYLKFSPPIVEYEAGIRFLYYCKVTGARGLMVHTSLPELVMEAEKGKKEGYSLYVETCPHYLYFTEDDLRKGGVYYKCAPTLRDKDTVRKMWEMLDKGYIDTIASDHVATPRHVLEESKDDLMTGGAGMPQLEHMINSVMNGVNKGWANIYNAIKALTEKPAKIYRLYPKKGTIQVGSDADLVLVDMDQELKITQETIITKANRSTFEGMTLKGNPVLTMVRGEIVVENRQVIGKPEYGQFVSRVDATSDN
jgi:dihydroorotase (multifunctional complex type)